MFAFESPILYHRTSQGPPSLFRNMHRSFIIHGIIRPSHVCISNNIGLSPPSQRFLNIAIIPSMETPPRRMNTLIFNLNLDTISVLKPKSLTIDFVPLSYSEIFLNWLEILILQLLLLIKRKHHRFIMARTMIEI